MKINTKQKKEVIEVYEIWLESYLNGDVKTYGFYFDDEYRFVGSTRNEEFLNRVDTIEFFKKIADQFAGKTDLKNSVRTVELIDGIVFVTELFDAYLQIESDWKYYGRFRFTSALSEKKVGWRFIYQHFSMPDSKAEEGETIGVEQISKENQELRDTIKRRTIELEQKNRDLEIETALEKVRSRTMAMQHSDELQEISFLLDSQVRALGIKTWGCAFNIYGVNESTEWFGNEAGVLPTYTVPRKGIFKEYFEIGKKGESLYIKEFSGAPCVAHYEYMSSLPVIGDVLKDLKKTNNGFPTFQIDHVVYFKYGYLLFITKEHVPYAHDIFKRFSKVFEQTYTRFLDLQKAEAQARESQIETALERIRAQAVAMKESTDLLDIVVTMRNEFIKLGHEAHYFWQMMWLPEIYEKAMTSGDGSRIGFVMKLPRYIHGDIPLLAKWEKSKKPTVVFPMDAETAIDYVDKMVNLGDFKNIDPQAPSHDDIRHIGGLTFIMARTSHGEIGYSLPGIVKNPPKEDLDILVRFAAAFDLAHQRFMDLQKAEAQARETQIELGLEKVRSRSMAMHKSNELKDVIQVLYNQFIKLNIKIEHAGFVIDYKENDDMHIWLADHNAVFPKIVLPYFDCAHWNSFIEAKKKGQNFFTNQLNFDEKNKFYNDLFEFIPDLPKETKTRYFSFDGLAISTALIDTVGLYVENFSGIPFSEEENKILMRFGKAFQQTYTRFLDLQKVEAQAKESQIEAALERVRAKSMAMHQSKDIGETVSTLFDELLKVGIHKSSRSGIGTLNETKNMKLWAGITNTSDEVNLIVGVLDMTINPLLKKIKNAWEQQVEHFYYELKDKELLGYYASLNQSDGYFLRTDLDNLPEKEFIHVFTFKHGIIFSFNSVPISDEAKQVFKRFAKVFELTYTRFLDLQKAEAQAREAQIEAALERVRSSSMAMHNSKELLKVITVVSNQLLELGIKFNHVSFGNYDNDDTFKFWASAKGKTQELRLVVPYINTTIFNNIKEAQKKSLTFITDVVSNEDHIIWHKHLLKHVDANLFSKEENAYIMSKGVARSIAINPNIMLILAKYDSIPYLAEENKIIERFGLVFEQSYTRFLDLQKAEAQAREALTETALEKVRSRTMAMQHSDELPEAANNLFLQVQGLGIPAWSAGYCIWEDKDKKMASCNMSSEGEIQKAFSLPTIGEGYDFYSPLKKGKDFYVAELGGKDLVKHYDFMKTLPIIGEVLVEFAKKGISLPTFQVWHIVFFTNGYLMFITYEPVEDQWGVFKRFGKVFEQTYTRFLDLKLKEDQATKLTAEKIRLEKTLKDLQATQAQLIQSEKMASLGELTAGIAHEIQNPLNFVNNFSELSEEMIEELAAEIKDNSDEIVIEIMTDLKQNLHKIANHGKRASSIVKGMLDHSRTSSGKKNLTDINALSDEFLRLSYHGLRAKDKTFNADFKSDLDLTIPKIEIVSQDIGRVILNLINNAFYAVNKRGKKTNEAYKPMVTLITKKVKNSIVITVKDNGIGISKDNINKIFQPFFTTKPTGQGTGLGLSLAYDIITKGHGGALTVSSEKGEFTKFTIVLPLIN